MIYCILTWPLTSMFLHLDLPCKLSHWQLDQTGTSKLDQPCLYLMALVSALLLLTCLHQSSTWHSDQTGHHIKSENKL